MSELDKKKSYTVDMRESTKQDLVRLSKQMKLAQGDTISYLLKEFDNTQAKLIDASNNVALMETIISQQNIIIKTLNENAAVMSRLLLK